MNDYLTALLALRWVIAVAALIGIVACVSVAGWHRSRDVIAAALAELGSPS